MDDPDLRRCLEALWDNSIDGRLADLKYDSNFDMQEVDLRTSFIEFLAATNG